MWGEEERVKGTMGAINRVNTLLPEKIIQAFTQMKRHVSNIDTIDRHVAGYLW